MESLYDIWGRRNPEWELRYQEMIATFSEYGKGTTNYREVRGKIFGAGYEVFILAFFIGLYANQTKALNPDKSKRKSFGYPISNWGSQEDRNGRKQYARLREYMFAALIARTDIDFIALDKGEITPQKVVADLVDTMEKYANFGFDYMHEKLEENPNYFFNDTAFLRTFLSFTNLNKESANNAQAADDDDEPESLD
jgi:hypothetical protein